MIVNTRSGAVLSRRPRFAETFLTRLRGLLGSHLEEGEALVLAPCTSVHMFFMTFPLDVVFTDRDGKVLALYRHLRPWRISGNHWSAHHAVELPVGVIDATGTEVGDTLEIGGREGPADGGAEEDEESPRQRRRRQEDSLLRVGIVVLVLVASLLQVGDQATYLALVATVAAMVGGYALSRERSLPPAPPLAAALLWCLLGLGQLLLLTSAPYQGKLALGRRGTQVGALATGTLAVSVPGGGLAVEGALLAAGAVHGTVAAVDSLQGRPGRAHWQDHGRFRAQRDRVAGLFPNPNLLGFFLALCLPLALGWSAEPGGGRRRLVGFVALLPLALGLGASYSRSAWITAAVGVAFLAWLQRPPARRRLIGPLVAVVVLTLAATPGVLDRAASLGERTEFGIDQRVKLYRGVARMAAAAPLLGHGPGTFHGAYPRFRLVGGQYPFDAHSQYLQELVESGAVGLLLFLVMFASAGRAMARHLGEERDRPGERDGPGEPGARALRDRQIAAAAALGVGALFATPLAYTALAVPAMLLLGVAAGPDRSQRSPAHASFGRGTNVLLALLVVYGCLAALAAFHAEQERGVVRQGVRGLAGLEPGPELRARAGELLVPDLMRRLELAELFDPGAPEHRHLEAEILLQLGLDVSAERAFEEALARDPRDSLAWKGIARAREARGELDGAIEALDRALALDPMAEDLLLHQAELYHLQGFLERAAGLLERALDTNPAFLRRNPDTYPRVIRALIEVRLAQGREDEAEGLRELLAEIRGDEVPGEPGGMPGPTGGTTGPPPP